MLQLHCTLNVSRNLKTEGNCVRFCVEVVVKNCLKQNWLIPIERTSVFVQAVLNSNICSSICSSTHIMEQFPTRQIKKDFLLNTLKSN